MVPIYSSSALKTRQREIKDVALKDVVHITENGNAAFVFCSEEIFDQRLREAAEQAAYEQRFSNAVVEGRKAISEGRYIEGTEAVFAEAARMRASRG